MHLAGIAIKRWQVGRQALLQFDVLQDHLMSNQQQAAFEDGIQIVPLRVNGRLAREGEQVFHDPAATPAFPFDDVQVVLGLAQPLALVEALVGQARNQLAVRQDAGQGIVDFVSDHRRQLAQ